MQVITSWEDFSGGHWGNLGPIRAEPNQYGGVNVLTDSQGNLSPMNSPDVVRTSTLPLSAVLGMYWNWGSDGRVYTVYMTTTSTAYVYGFIPSTTTTSTTVFGGISSTAAITRPDFCTVSDTVYITVYGGKTWALNPTSETTIKLTGSYGDAPAGRCIAPYGERLVVAGISDARYSTIPNRVVFSGDDTNNNPTDRTAWETLNYFDVGPTDRTITGLYPLRDSLVVVMEDQTVWLVTGVLGSSAVVRRMNGFDKGSGGLRAYRQSHGTVDPSQTKVWMFNHRTKGLMRFNGVSLNEAPNIGVSIADREGTLSDLAYVGETVSIGGPDEIFSLGTFFQGEAGPGIKGLIRTKGRLATFNSTIFSAVAIGFNGTAGQFVVSNDRYQVIVCTSTGDGAAQPEFEIWSATDSTWGTETVNTLASDYQVPYKMGTVVGTVYSPIKEFTTKSGELTEAQIEGLLVEFIPHPLAVNQDGTTSTTSIGFTVGLNGYGIPSYTRAVSGAQVSGVNVSTTATFSTTIGTSASDVWPNIRTQFFPMRFSRIGAAQVSLTSLQGCKIVRVRILGKTFPSRLA